MSDTHIDVIVPGNHLMTGLLGHRDELLRQIERSFPATDIHVRGNEISIGGPDAEEVGRLFEELVLLLQQGQPIDSADVSRSIDMVRAAERPSKVLSADILRGAKGRVVRPKTSGQKRYVDAIAENVITFGLGPAGTGKSWLAVAMAVQALQAKEVQRIILTRPAVEAGERLGLPARRPHGQGRSRTCARCTTPSTTWSTWRAPRSCSSARPSRWRRWPSCGAARSTPASSSSTRRRTPRPSRSRCS